MVPVRTLSTPYGELYALAVEGSSPAIRLTEDKWEDSLAFWGDPRPLVASDKQRPLITTAKQGASAPASNEDGFLFTPGFSPVMNGNKSRGTVLTVCFSGHNTQAVERENYINYGTKKPLKLFPKFRSASHRG